MTVSGEGVAARHARVSLDSTGVQVEDLGSGIGTLVNGYLITKRVVVSYPASVQIGELTLVVEENPIAEEIAVSEEAAAPASDQHLGVFGRPERLGGPEGRTLDWGCMASRGQVSRRSGFGGGGANQRSGLHREYQHRPDHAALEG
ncbi:MAG: FHA domain-containing protein [Proteobacteria bacterium]|nr:FHA domain-containing protein [Pseudomonadota bacterium]